MKKLEKILEKIENEVVFIGKKLIVSLNKIWKKFLKLKKKAPVKSILLLIGTITLFSISILGIWFITLPLPDINSFNNRVLAQSTKIFDRTGKILLYDVGKNMRRTVVSLDKISPNLKNATISIEDEDFYSHHGIKITSIFRAFISNILSFEFTQGGSTITQQVVKNTLLTKEKTITRKIKEAFLSIKIERALTKDEILYLYLNESSYGGTIYGVEEASQAYFGKNAENLSIAESAYLASLTKAPSYFSPYGQNRDALEVRKNLVLQKMYQLKYITEDEYKSAKEEKVSFKDQFSRGIKAPHFVMYVKQFLEEKYGEETVNQGGLKVITTLDYELQKKAEDIVKTKAIENGKKYNATNAALVAIDANEGEILVMVGSRDYFDKEIEGNFNVATAKRQPGSSFKPFVYAEGFNKGYTPETILFDVETQFSTNCPVNYFGDRSGCYSPQNYDGKFRGPMTIRNALAQSINIPAVKMLYLVGIKDVLDLTKRMGITSLENPDRYGLSLVLGGGEVTLLEMTSAYGVFANQGERVVVSPILSIEDKSGNKLEEKKIVKTRVIPKETTLQIASILSDEEARSPVFGRGSSLYFANRDVAVKTGTTNDYKDAWIIGFTPKLSVGAWAGNNNNSSIDSKVAGYIVGPMWKEFMNEILKAYPDQKFESYQENNPDLKPILRGIWQPQENEGVNGIHSILYFVDKENPRGARPTNPSLDPQYDNWEYGVRRWAESQSFIALPPNTSGNNNNLSINITSPIKDASFNDTEKINLSVKIFSKEKIIKVDYFANNIFIGSSNINPYSYSFTPANFNIESGELNIRALVTDEVGNISEDTKKYKIK